MTSPSTLTALSPLDGRYHDKLAALRPLFSEYGLIRARLRVELAWLQALADRAGFAELAPFAPATGEAIEHAVASFSESDAAAVKAIEARTNHDVKALEYWLRQRFADNAQVQGAAEFIHFACTSEDINNLAYGLIVTEAREHVLLPALGAIEQKLGHLAHTLAELPMLSRTHGQAATPTTLGKEMANFLARLRGAREIIAAVRLSGKFNGAVGNFNAHLAAYPEFAWEAFARDFVQSFGLEYQIYSTQIEPHDCLSQLFDAISRANNVLLDLDRDLWGYISLGYFKQKLKQGEVGSSTMPHKVNPIDFENSEGNLGIANALLRHLAEKLPISRWQRDLSDSTALRNVGSALGYSLLAYQSCLRGLDKLEANPQRLREDLDANWEILAEPIQTVMRRYGVPDAYDRLKDLTRGAAISRESLLAFIGSLEIPETEKQRLLALTPATYLGMAAELARRI